MSQNPAKVHKRLYDKIPTFDCKPGCSDCCGIVPFSIWEWGQVPHKDHAPGCLKCPYVTADDCSIYPDRPMMCRLFGAVDRPMLTCPHGCGPERKLTEAEAQEILKEYRTKNVKVRNFNPEAHHVHANAVQHSQVQ